MRQCPKCKRRMVKHVSFSYLQGSEYYTCSCGYDTRDKIVIIGEYIQNPWRINKAQ